MIFFCSAVRFGAMSPREAAGATARVGIVNMWSRSQPYPLIYVNRDALGAHVWGAGRKIRSRMHYAKFRLFTRVGFFAFQASGHLRGHEGGSKQARQPPEW